MVTSSMNGSRRNGSLAPHFSRNMLNGRAKAKKTAEKAPPTTPDRDEIRQLRAAYFGPSYTARAKTSRPRSMKTPSCVGSRIKFTPDLDQAKRKKHRASSNVEKTSKKKAREPDEYVYGADTISRTSGQAKPERETNRISGTSESGHTRSHTPRLPAVSEDEVALNDIVRRGTRRLARKHRTPGAESEAGAVTEENILVQDRALHDSKSGKTARV